MQYVYEKIRTDVSYIYDGSEIPLFRFQGEVTSYWPPPVYIVHVNRSMKIAPFISSNDNQRNVRQKIYFRRADLFLGRG
jgi:hypothetical protein